MIATLRSAAGVRRSLAQLAARSATKSTRSGTCAVGDDAALRALVPEAVGLEGDGAGHDAAVEFGQHHVHGEVAGVEALGALPPAFLRRAGENDLQHRAIMSRQRIGAAARGDGEAGGVEDHVRRAESLPSARRLTGRSLRLAT